MCDNPKITIIVPVYNVETYLRQCLDSVINQTFKEIEIIVVNDGSTDGSLKICEEYAKKDKRIIVINKKNGGLSDARNCGLKIAKAKYIGFVDSDDYIKSDFYEKMYDAIQKSGVDIVVSSIIKVDNCGNYLYRSGYSKEGTISNLIAMKSMLNARGISNSVCNKLFKRELFSEEPFPVGKLYEDEYVTYRIIDQCPYIYNLNSTAYYYRTNISGITHRKFSDKELDRIEASLKRIEYLEKRHKNLVSDGKRYLMYDCLTTISKMEKYDHRYDEIVLNNIRNNLMSYLRGKSSKGAKLFAILSAISPDLAVFMFRIVKNRT